MASNVLSRWHRLIDSGNPSGLARLLADDVVFHSPIVHTPQHGKAITTRYLEAAFAVLVNETFHYVREIVGDNEAALEFQVEIDGLSVNGVDLVKWDGSGKITEFKVMVRPLKAINLIHEKMAAMLSAAAARANQR